MSSSYKVKKAKTVATRKRTRKRKADNDLTFEDESGRLFQPPSIRDPRWKQPKVEELVTTYSKSQYKKEVKDKNAIHQAAIIQEQQSNVNKMSPIITDAKRSLEIHNSIDNAMDSAATIYKDIRSKDKRQKAKVLLLMDTRSLFNAAKRVFEVKTELSKSKSSKGVRSEKLVLAYRNIAPLKTPLQRFTEANQVILNQFKIGKLSTLVAEDVTYMEYTDMKFQHVILMAKAHTTLLKVNNQISRDTQLHSVLVSENDVAEDIKGELNSCFNII